MGTSESHHGSSGLNGLAVKHGIGLGADWIVGRQQIVRIRRTRRKEVANREDFRARVLAEAGTAPDRPGHRPLSRVEHYEEEGAVRAEIALVASALKPPAPPSAGGEVCACASEEVV
jgi:hypothetical protein